MGKERGCGVRWSETAGAELREGSRAELPGDTASVLSSDGPEREESGRKGREKQTILQALGSAVCKLPQGLGANFMGHCGQRFLAHSCCRQVMCTQVCSFLENGTGILLCAAML